LTLLVLVKLGQIFSTEFGNYSASVVPKLRKNDQKFSSYLTNTFYLHYRFQASILFAEIIALIFRKNGDIFVTAIVRPPSSLHFYLHHVYPIHEDKFKSLFWGYRNLHKTSDHLKFQLTTAI